MSGLMLGFLGIHFHWPDLNPFHWVRNWLRDLYNSVGKEFQHLVLNRPHLPSGLWQYSLYGNSLGVAEKAMYAIVIMALIIALFAWPFASRLPRIFGIALAVYAVGPYFFAFCNFLITTGDQLAQSVVVNPNGGDSQLMLLPQINNILGLILALIVLITLGFILVAILFSYVLFGEIIKVIFLPLLAVGSVWEFAENLISWIIRIAIVIFLVSPFITVGCLSLGVLANNNIPDVNAGVTFLLLTVSLLLAIALNIILLVMAHYGVAKVTGKVRAIVRGAVEVVNHRREEVTIRNPESAQLGMMQPAYAVATPGAVSSIPNYSVDVREGAAQIRMKMNGPGISSTGKEGPSIEESGGTNEQ